VFPFFWDVMLRHWVTGAGRSENTKSPEDAAVVRKRTLLATGSFVGCRNRNVGKFSITISVTGSLVRGSECREFWYKDLKVGKFGTRI